MIGDGESEEGGEGWVFEKVCGVGEGGEGGGGRGDEGRW